MFTKTRRVINGTNAIVAGGLGAYSLSDTLECGQFFRYERLECKWGMTRYLITHKNKVLTVGQERPGELIFFDISEEDFDNIAAPFFALDLSLAQIKQDILSHTDSEWLRRAADLGEGIAILRQEPWEALLSFIISQNNNIPRIRKIIKSISVEYGVNLSMQNGNITCPLDSEGAPPCEEKCKACGICYSFPRAEDIAEHPEKLTPSHPGFRYKYMCDAADAVLSERVKLEEISAARSFEYTLESLKKIKGVGDKVASCVALFAFNCLDAFPIDVWMRRALDTYFPTDFNPDSLGKYRGVAQQYIFHYIRNHTDD